MQCLPFLAAACLHAGVEGVVRFLSGLSSSSSKPPCCVDEHMQRSVIKLNTPPSLSYNQHMYTKTVEWFAYVWKGLFASLLWGNDLDYRLWSHIASLFFRTAPGLTKVAALDSTAFSSALSRLVANQRRVEA